MMNVKADFIRNGNAKRIMGLSKEHTTALWNAVQDSMLNPSLPLFHSPTPFVFQNRVTNKQQMTTNPSQK